MRQREDLSPERIMSKLVFFIKAAKNPCPSKQKNRFIFSFQGVGNNY
jgi:hypothetical protein